MQKRHKEAAKKTTAARAYKLYTQRKREELCVKKVKKKKEDGHIVKLFHDSAHIKAKNSSINLFILLSTGNGNLLFSVVVYSRKKLRHKYTF